MGNHLDEISGYEGKLNELAQSVGNLKYNRTSDFIEELADDLMRQADADAERGRGKLASKLYETAAKLYEARDRMNLAWDICEPYMKE